MPSGGSPSQAEDRKQVRSVASRLSQLPQFSYDPCHKANRAGSCGAAEWVEPWNLVLRPGLATALPL